MATMSRFRIHDEESAPEGSVPILKGALRSGGQLPNFLGVLGGAPAALRAYMRFRAELRKGTLPAGTPERIGLAVAALLRSETDSALHARAARAAGIGGDEVRRAQRWDSTDVKQAALLSWLKPLAEHAGSVPVHLHEAAMEAGWTEEQLLEAIGVVAMESFQAMVDVAGDVPVDGSSEQTRTLRAVA
jgi:alkylhydroperoxidase family enzyme